MKPVLKWLLFGIGALLVLGVAVIIAVVTLVNPDRFRPAIVAAVQQSTGRTLTLGGDVGLKLVPCCAVEVTRATLGNPPGFDSRAFLSVESARLAIRIWPLLTRRDVEIGTVRIEGLEANLVGRKDGSNNWTFTDPSPGAPPAGSEPGSQDVPSTFNLAGISLKDARLNYSDEADGSRYRVEQLQLDTGAVRNGAPFDISTSFRLIDLADNTGGTFGLKAQASVNVDGDVTKLGFKTLEGELDTTGLGGLEGLRGTLRSPELQVKLADDTLVEAAGLTVDLQATGADLPGGAAPVKATLSGLRYDVDAGTGVVTGFTATSTVAGVALDLAGEGGFGAANELRGTVRFAEFSPRDVLATLKADVPVTADPAVLTRLSGTANWFLRDTSVGLEQLAVLLDDTKLAGSLARELLPDGSKATPRTQFDLTLDKLDADRYLEPDAPSSGMGDSAKNAESPTEIPAKAIRALNLRGRARVGQLTINGLRLASVDVSTAADGGRLRLEPFAAKLYGGTVRGVIQLDATGAKSRLTLDQVMTGVNFGALLTDLADVKNITGTMNLDLDGTAVGATDDELLSTLDGNLAFSLSDGTYQGMDVWYEIRRAQALLRRKAPPVRTGPEQTPIKLLDLAGKVTDGELRTDRFSAEIPFLRVAGNATVNLPKSTLDSKLTALVFEKPVFGDDTSLEDLVGVRIPLTIRGPVADPKVGVDLSKMAKEAAKDTVRKALEDKLRDRLGLGKPADGDQPAPAAPKEDPLKDALDRLFKKGAGP